MAVKIFEDLDNQLLGIYLEHERVVEESHPKYELNESVFAINEPFYMKTEKEAIIRDNNQTNHKTNKNNKRNKRKANKIHIYESLLTQSQKQVIAKIFNDVKHTIKQLSTNSINDNKSCEQMAQKALSLNDFHEYSDRLLCNESNSSLMTNNFIIPANCSLMSSDVIHGLKTMHNHYIEGKLIVSQQLLVVIDPPWLSNKSVKRKRCYRTDDNQNILEMTHILNDLFNSFPKQTDIKVCIWSTHKEKDFVVNQMIPNINCKTTHVLVWHKITRRGQSCKLRGSLEYLIIASNNSFETNYRNGILVSIPSAIHSHKPPLKHLIDSLFDKNCVKSVGNEGSTPVEIVSTDSEPNSVKNHNLSNAIISRVSGLELYARYLSSGFHSIGYECLKLQNFDLYSIIQK